MGRTKRTPHLKLLDAYDANKGVTLTRKEVDELILDDAIRRRALLDREAVARGCFDAWHENDTREEATCPTCSSV